MRALVLSCTLKQSPATSNTEVLARVLVDALEREKVETELIRLVDLDIKPGVRSDEGDGDAWPAVRERILASEILIMADPTWVGKPSSIAQRAIERMDAMLSETDAHRRPVAYNKVAGVVVTGNEDGAHHVISEIARPSMDLLEHGSGPGRRLPRHRPQARLVPHNRRDRHQPARRRSGTNSPGCWF